jgi:hypothetical protein
VKILVVILNSFRYVIGLEILCSQMIRLEQFSKTDERFVNFVVPKDYGYRRELDNSFGT